MDSKWLPLATASILGQAPGEDIISIDKIVTSCSGLSHHELGLTICELLEWERDNGKLKSRECWDLLNQPTLHK